MKGSVAFLISKRADLSVKRIMTDTSILIQWSQNYPHTKIRLKCNKKEELQANISHEQRSKSIQKIIIKLSLTVHKKNDILWQNEIHSSYGNMDQYSKVNQCKPPINRSKNHMIISTNAERPFENIQHPLMIKIHR